MEADNIFLIRVLDKFENITYTNLDWLTFSVEPITFHLCYIISTVESLLYIFHCIYMYNFDFVHNNRYVCMTIS